MKGGFQFFTMENNVIRKIGDVGDNPKLINSSYFHSNDSDFEPNQVTN